MLPESAILEFKTLLETSRGCAVSMEEATELANKFLRFMKVILITQK